MTSVNSIHCDIFFQLQYVFCIELGRCAQLLLASDQLADLNVAHCMNTMDQLPFNQGTDSVGIIDAGECGDEHRGGKEMENNRRGRRRRRDRRDQLSLLILTTDLEPLLTRQRQCEHMTQQR